MNITCDKCGKDSGIEETNSWGRNAALVEAKNWISKMLVLYTNRPHDQFIVCSTECATDLTRHIFADAGVTKERKTEVDSMLAESKKRIPAMAAETVRAASAFHQALMELTGRKL